MKQIILSLFGLLLVYTINAQTEKSNNLPRGSFGIGYNYILSSHKTNASPSNTLFEGNGHSIGMTFRWNAKRTGINTDSNGQINERKLSSKLSLGVALRVDASFQFGTTSNKDLEAFAKSLTSPLGYKITQSGTNWQQFVVMAGPSFTLRRNGSISINLNQVGNSNSRKRVSGFFAPAFSVRAGVAFNTSPKTITIDKIDGAVNVGRVYTATEKKAIFAWQADVELPVAKLGKRVNLCLDAGYGYNGARVGIVLSITGKVVVERIIKTK